MAPSTEQEQKNKQIVRQFIELHDRQDLERAEQLVSITNYLLYYSGMPPMDWNGHKKLYLGIIIKAFPDYSHNIEDMVAEGDKVAVYVNNTGTHKGEFHGILPTGKKVSFYETDFLTIINGKVTEEKATADMMALMQQIGAAIPTPSRAETDSTPRS
jgi:predicted ester cyclase